MFSRHWRIRVALITGLLAMVLAGCGGSGDSSDDSAPAPSKAEFVRRANAVCSTVFSEINRTYAQLGDLNGGRPTAAEVDAGAAEIVPPMLSRLVKRLRELDSPSGEASRIDEMLTALESGIETAEDDVATVRGENAPFAFQDAYEMLWAYGLTKCGLG